MSDKKGVFRHVVANMNCVWSKQHIISLASHVIRERDSNYLATPVKIINQNGRSNAVPCAVRTVSVQNDNHGF